MITITGPKTLTLPAALGGNDEIYGLVLVCVTRGLFVEDSPGSTDVELSGIKDRSLLSLPVVALLVSQGAEVWNYPVFFEIDDPTAPCPFANQNPVDAYGLPQPVETWETWGTFQDSHKPFQLDGKWYRTNNVGYSGEPLPASKWIVPPAGVTLKTVEEIQAIPLDAGE